MLPLPPVLQLLGRNVRLAVELSAFPPPNAAPRVAVAVSDPRSDVGMLSAITTAEPTKERVTAKIALTDADST